jgi:hypothetical protein
MKILDLLFRNVQTTHFLTFEKSRKWERTASFMVRLKGKDPDNAYCGACKLFSAIPDELQKGLCAHMSSKNVVVFTRVTDYCCYFVARCPVRLETMRLNTMIKNRVRLHHFNPGLLLASVNCKRPRISA